tara:strand:- start:313 stop:609 length:297 start_codon:yes stop_codon:yes gene_type:complete
MATFLQSVKVLADGKFFSDPVLNENVLTIDISDDQFIAITTVYIPQELGQHIHYLLTNVQFDGHGIETCRKIIYAQDDDSQQAIYDYILALQADRWAA